MHRPRTGKIEGIVARDATVCKISNSHELSATSFARLTGPEWVDDYAMNEFMHLLESCRLPGVEQPMHAQSARDEFTLVVTRNWPEKAGAPTTTSVGGRVRNAVSTQAVTVTVHTLAPTSSLYQSTSRVTGRAGLLTCSGKLSNTTIYSGNQNQTFTSASLTGFHKTADARRGCVHFKLRKWIIWQRCYTRSIRQCYEGRAGLFMIRKVSCPICALSTCHCLAAFSFPPLTVPPLPCHHAASNSIGGGSMAWQMR